MPTHRWKRRKNSGGSIRNYKEEEEEGEGEGGNLYITENSQFCHYIYWSIIFTSKNY